MRGMCGQRYAVHWTKLDDQFSLNPRARPVKNSANQQSIFEVGKVASITQVRVARARSRDIFWTAFPHREFISAPFCVLQPLTLGSGDCWIDGGMMFISHGSDVSISSAPFH